MISTIELDERVIKPGLCVNCGACQGMCPYWQSGEGRTYTCFDCDRTDGRCVRFCPRMPADKAALREKFFDKESVLPEIGPYKGLYITRAADASACCGKQHGGTVTALLKLALEEGIIDSAVLTKTTGLDAEGVLAATADEIDACGGSSFRIPPTLAVLNKALGEGIYKKIGVVGTPCKTLAVYKMKAAPFAENDNHKENIGLVIGLFCGWGLDWQGFYELAARHADPAAVKHVDIPPSKYHCIEFDKTSVELDEVYPIVRESCKFCGDMTAEFSDISVGGARSADGWEVDKGWNQVIVRSEAGERLMRLAREKGILEFKETTDANLEKLKKAAESKRNKAKKSI